MDFKSGVSSFSMAFEKSISRVRELQISVGNPSSDSALHKQHIQIPP
jgi:hypothetical protein